MAGARLRPLLDLADVLGGLGVDLLELLEDGVADRLGQEAEEVGAIVGRHLARDVRHALGRHQLDDLFLLVLVEALEDRRGVLGGQPREELGGLVGVELADEVGEVLGVDLVEQLAHLIRILLEELFQIGAEQRREAHETRRTLMTLCRPARPSVVGRAIVSCVPVATIIARSTTLRSSRMLPGQA